MLWPRKGSLMKTQTWILDNRLYYTRKIELHRKGKKSRTVHITPIVLITVRRVHYSKMGKVPTTIRLTFARITQQVLTFCKNKLVAVTEKLLDTFSSSFSTVSFSGKNNILYRRKDALLSELTSVGIDTKDGQH